MIGELDDTALRAFLKLCPKPMTGLRESEHWIGFPGIELAIHKRDPRYTTGWVMSLPEQCLFLRRWFDSHDLNRRGWAIIFRLIVPEEGGARPAEYFGGWVEHEQEALADAWIARLNEEIRARLASKGTTGDRANLGAAGAAPGDHAPIRLVGNFREMGDPSPHAPSLVETRGRRGRAHKQEVLTYLRTAPVIVFSPGLSEDYFEPTRRIKGPSMRTDGTYVWPEYLAYYVDRYDVELPPDFEAHMHTLAWQLPQGLDVRTLRLPWWGQVDAP